jgi:hypothetical protein
MRLDPGIETPEFGTGCVDMWDWEIQEPHEEEEWHGKISHQDQNEFTFPEPEPMPEPEAQKPAEAPADSNAQFPYGAGMHANAQEIPVHPPTFAEVWMPRIRKFLSVPANFYATVGVGIGLLCGLIFAAIFWHGNNPTGPYDLGSVSSTVVGLKGRLFTKWDKNLQYRLTFEPSAPERLAGFSTAIENSPHPLSIGIQLTDPQGFVLCSKSILIKYDSRNAEPAEGDAETEEVAADPQVRSRRAELAEAQESVREQGNDVFQNQLGANGQVTTVTAQGDLPCTASAYESAVAWNFSPDFPSVAEQEALIRHLGEKPARDAANSPAAIAARRRPAARAAANPPPKFYIEGEDAIVDYDAAAGIIATRGGKNFTIDKAGVEAASLKGHDFPLHVHYRCDQFGNCTLYTAGVGTQHTKLRK